jgi:hypothetical protein
MVLAARQRGSAAARQRPIRLGLEALEDRILPSVNPVMPDFSSLYNNVAQFRNDVTTTEVALFNAFQLSPTNTPTAASISSQWGQAWSVFAADLSKTYQAFVQVEDAALAVVGQELNMLLDGLGIQPPDQSSSSSPSAAPPTSPTPAPPISTPPPATGSGLNSSADPFYVLDLNTGETIPANVTLNTFSTWSEDLLAQVSGTSVSSYSWNVSQA